MSELRGRPLGELSDEKRRTVRRAARSFSIAFRAASCNLAGCVTIRRRDCKIRWGRDANNGGKKWLSTNRSTKKSPPGLAFGPRPRLGYVRIYCRFAPGWPQRRPPRSCMTMPASSPTNAARRTAGRFSRPRGERTKFARILSPAIAAEGRVFQPRAARPADKMPELSPRKRVFRDVTKWTKFPAPPHSLGLLSDDQKGAATPAGF
jgi:hypothetical protein